MDEKGTEWEEEEGEREHAAKPVARDTRVSRHSKLPQGH